MIVLHVTEALGGGVQSSIAHFIEQTPAARHVVYGNVREGENTVLHKDAEIIEHRGSTIAFARGLRRVLQKVQPGAVHFHSSIAGVLRPFARRHYVLYSPHCFAFVRRDIGPVKRGIFRMVERTMARWTDCYVAVSPYEAWLAGELRRSVEVVTVSNLGAVRVMPPCEPTSREVITSGRISRQKDPLLFAEVSNLTGESIHFTWVGDGDVEQRAVLEAAGVEVTGWLTRTEIEARLDAAGLYLHTAAWEASPMALAEALTARLAVICRSEPSLSSLGYYTVPSDPQKLSSAVESYFDDLEFRDIVSAQAVDVARRLGDIPTGALLMAAYERYTAGGCSDG